MSVTPEQIKGKAEEVAGVIEKTVGKAVGSDKLGAKGEVLEIKGKVRQEVAKGVEHMKEAAAAVDKAAKKV